MSLKVQNEPGLIRDPASKAIVNIDSEGFNAYIARRDQMLAQKVTLEKHAQEIDSIKSDLTEIKSLLLQLLSNNK